jgi:serine/threonine protein kinase
MNPNEVARDGQVADVPQLSAPPDADDPRVIRALEEYSAALKAGRKPNRLEILARYADVAEVLGECLDGLEFIQATAPQLGASTFGPDADKYSMRAGIYPDEPLGDFRILREVGRGGMGVVYEATQISLGRRVALKVLPFASALDAKQLQRFKNEAQAAAHLHHPHIVPVYGVGCDRGVHYYAMQYIDGQTLATVIREFRCDSGLESPEVKQTSKAASVHNSPTGTYTPGVGRTQGGAGQQRNSRFEEPATPPVAAFSTERSATGTAFFQAIVKLGVQAAEALEHAHQLGVVHRDIKPANLLVDGHGDLWVTDFGLAHCQNQAGLTMTGDLVGTLRYMSPEQALAQRVSIDHRTDIYSLGATLYEMLTLEPVFDGNDRQELLRQIAFDEPRRPRQVNPSIPFELETIVLKAMEKNPTERYASAQELADDLLRYLSDEPIRAQRPSLMQRARKWSRRHRPVVWSGGIAMAGMLIMLIVGLIVNNVLVEYEKLETEKALDIALHERNDKIEALRVAVSEKDRADNNLLLVTREKIEKEKALDIAVNEKNRADKNLARAREAVKKYLVKTSENPRLKSVDLHALRKDLLATAIPYLEAFAAQKQDDPELEKERGWALGDLAMIREDLGELQQARADTEQRIDVFNRLVTAFPKDPRYRHELAQSHRNLGHLHLRLAQPAKAEKALDDGRILMEALHAEFDGFPQYLQDLAGCYANLSVLLRHLSRPSAAMIYCQKALTLRERLPKGPSDPPVHRRDLGQSYMNLATLLRDAGQDKESLESARRGVSLFESLAAELPEVSEYRESWADSLNNLGVLLCEFGQLNEAVKAHREAVRIHRQLADDFPSLPDYRANLAASLNNLGMLLDDLGRQKEALAVQDESLPIIEKLARTYRDVPEYRQRLALTHTNRGHILMLLDQCDEALTANQQAIALQEELVKSDPRVMLWRQDLGRSQNNLAELLRKMGRYDEALTAALRGMTVREKLAADAPTNPAFALEVAGSYGTRANVLSDGGQLEEALKWYAKAFAKLDPILEKNPRLALARQFAFTLHDGRAVTLERLGRVEDAAKDLERMKALKGPTAARVKASGSPKTKVTVTKPIPTDVGNVQKGTLTQADPLDSSPLTKRGHYKTHTVELEAGQPYLIDLQGDFDTWMRIEDSERNTLLFNDDVYTGPNSQPADLNSRMVFIAPKKSTYRLVVTSFAAGETGTYSLGIQKAIKVGEPIVIKATLQKTDIQNREGKFIKFHPIKLVGGSPYTIEVESAAFDTFLGLLDEAKRGLVNNDDIAPNNTRLSRIDFTPKMDAAFNLAVTSFGPNEIGAYTLTVQRYEVWKETKK